MAAERTDGTQKQSETRETSVSPPGFTRYGPSFCSGGTLFIYVLAKVPVVNERGLGSEC